ncbi:UNVERIFIED_CONTAM: hypothetical protein FKN15_064187 [Acipenser sinensis]
MARSRWEARTSEYRRALSEFVYIQEGSVRPAGTTTPTEPFNCKTGPVKAIAQPGPSEYRRALSEFVYIQEGSVRPAGTTTTEPFNCKTGPVKAIAQPGPSEWPGVAGRPGLQK